ncbi:uncharacterized protein [Halyomorpha halys]|uniref:uncharacterized protein isoform X2 n=1 Tax=Halyomorpha halys TaxID=286706 RepID=UPI0034D1DC61
MKRPINRPSPSDRIKCKSQKNSYGKKIEKEEEPPPADLSDISDDCFTDILSSDSDDSSIEEMKNALLSLRTTGGEAENVEEEELPEGDKSAERMIFYSMYLDDDFNYKEEPDIEPQRSDGFDNYRPYSGLEAYLKDKEAEQYIWGELESEEFENLMNAGLKDELGLEDIDGNVSIKTLAENNFEVLGMDGPTRKIALIFDYKPEDSFHLSNEFRDFMNSQKEKYTYIGGVLLLYEEIGIHIIEKSFNQYACYKGEPPKLKQKMPEKICNYSESIKFLKQLGKRLNSFLKFVYSDQPSVFEDNKIPEDVCLNLPPKEYFYFALKGDWTPGLRPVDEWFENAIVLATEADDSEFVFPPRSDHLPVHILHTTPGEDENLRKATTQEIKGVKLPSTKPLGYKEEKVEKVQKKDEFGNPIHPFNEAMENLLDTEYEYLPEQKSCPEDFSEGEKGYNSQSSAVDPEEINTDLEDYLDHIESINK